MTSTPRRLRATFLAGLTSAALAVSLVSFTHPGAASAATGPAVTAALPVVPNVVTPGDPVAGVADLTDPVTAEGAPLDLEPTAAQTAAATALGPGVSVTWNTSGTPESVSPRTGVLATGSGTPEETAREFLRAHTGLLGISTAQVDGLVATTQPLAATTATSVLFEQRFDGVAPATRGMVTVGITAAGDVAYLSSSLAKATRPMPAATMTPIQGWLTAARTVGFTGIAPTAVTTAAKTTGDWTSLEVPSFPQTQLVRLRAFPTADGQVRPAYEADVVNVQGGSSTAYRVIVDAVNGTLLYRQNATENVNSINPSYVGNYPSAGDPLCSADQTFSVPDNTTKTVAVAAVAAVAADDITVKIFGPGHALLAMGDTATSPEVATYTAPGNTTLAMSTGYAFQVCKFDSAQIGGPYSATLGLTEAATPTVTTPQPLWRAFAANPPLDTVNSAAPFGPSDNTLLECWYASDDRCAVKERHENVNSFAPWDALSNGLPTGTTVGNNANTHEAWLSPLTPGGFAQAPMSATRDYTEKFTDVWNNSRCATGNLVPGGNDIRQVVTNLFVGHNRIHDFAYGLGFTERNYNLQTDNGGKGGQGGDAEVGNVQAGAITGGSAGMFMGRDNANQIALQDGVPGITNQYLFQPIAGAFYSPCADGALDTGIYGHEYTHAISNRMVGGPNDGLTSPQGGAMGESWSDLDAGEYQFENDYPTGTNPWALGAYTTGNFAKGIRDYAINDNPLNYSDYGFDSTGPEVHADGEIWNGTQWEVRQALVNKWNASYPYTDKALQLRCATPTQDPTRSQPSADQCPGNRRWLQLIYDAWLLQPGADSMLIARDTMLAADRMRFGGADQAEIASAFARRGMGDGASTKPDDTDPITSFRSAYGNNAAVTFSASSADGKIFVGDYEARATPVADLIASTDLPASATFTPGVYKMTYVSPTRGFRRFVMVVPDSGAAFTQSIDDGAVNVASAASGGSIISSSSGSINPTGLIDGTEGTSWAGVVGSSDSVDVTHPQITIGLSGGVQTVTSVKVSALLGPATTADADAGSRFTALRQFALEACTANCSAAGATFSRFYTSPADAFPGDIPRPVVPDQTMRSFAVPATAAAAIRLVALENQCTGQNKYAGQQISDPKATYDTDCKSGSDRDHIVHASELQVFSAPVPADPASGTPGDGTPGSGTAGQGNNAPALPGQPILGGGVGATTTGGTTGTTGSNGGTASPFKTKVLTELTPKEQVRGDGSSLRIQVIAKGSSGKRTSAAKITSGNVQAGVVVVRIDGKKMRKAGIKVTAKHRHKVRGKLYRLPVNLSYGAHRIQVKFKPYDKARFTKAKSHRLTYTVVRTLPSAR